MDCKRLLIITLLTFALQNLTSAQTNLRVSDNGRYLVYKNGKPFFYLGDTAWELFHRLNREEATTYLKNRAEKGFTAIQAVVLAEHDGLHDPNPYGQTPLINDDPAKPNEAYFEHVDFIVNKAEELGLYIAMLPTWGDKVFKNKWGVGPEIFNTQNIYTYGKYLGNRYKNKKNIIWVIGGDRNPRENSQDVEIWRSLAKGITEGVGGQENALMTYHPQPQKEGSSSTWFQQDDWLDFNMFQTGHCPDVKVWELMGGDYNRTPVKPTMDGEPLYEEIPVCFDTKNGYAQVVDIRRRAYISLFAGAHGFTYGCNNIWQMYAPGRKPTINPTRFWYESLDLPGANAMTDVRKLIESRPMLDRVPDQSLITNSPDNQQERIQATRGKDYAFIYSASGNPFEVNMGKISGKQVNAFWFDPRTGKSTKAGAHKNTGKLKFMPPTKGDDQDWVLVLDDACRRFPIL
ncbi:glycoside hydrolase family 140 protein [Adhaeribacter aquaticus]|uniref:glycoside hydrolase family 140 protein n=1 Tax=Adhaeribacter aquaticus TaxID=299567 RepID=UPI000428BFF0|nr:glycoside hydrolase family 140 protein [Adhaeribacter aquaticus]